MRFYLILFVAVLSSCNSSKDNQAVIHTVTYGKTDQVLEEPIQPLPYIIYIDKDKVNLGKQLFYDTRFSGNNTISCASCHDLILGGVDRRKTSIGIYGNRGKVNAPTVFNAVFNFRQNWDGSAKNLEAQLDGPINKSYEMNSDWQMIVKKLKQDVGYQKSFKKIYGEKHITEETIKDALVTFEKSLITPSRFDDYLLGNNNAINAKELQGYQKFKDYGCIACHQGVNIGGNMFQIFGIMGNYFQDQGKVSQEYLGRYNVTYKEQDKFKFKVPSLRNITLTAPYFHDGSVATLEEAIEIMAKYQLGRPISNQDRDLIILFLKTLEGKTLQQDS